MTLISRLAWRNTLRQKRRTLLTILTMFGGFTLSAISIGWADGTYNRIIEEFTRNRLGHIQIHAEGYSDKPTLHNGIESADKIGKQLEEVDGVRAWSPRFLSAGLASVESESAAVQILGIDPQLESETTHYQDLVSGGRALSEDAAREALLGKGLAEKLKAQLGDEVVIVSQGADGSIANDLYTLVGIVSSGDDLTDRSILYLHLRDAQELFVLPGGVHEIVIVADRLDGVRRLAQEIRRLLDASNLVVEPWQDFARSFYVAMQADKKGSWVMLFIIMLIVAIGVLNTVLMAVLERTREYGVLKALGTRPFQIFRLVMTEVLIMALLGVVLGALTASGINAWLAETGIAMPEPITYGGMTFERFYSEVNAHSLYIPAIVVILSAWLVSLVPALRAARILPAEALRRH